MRMLITGAAGMLGSTLVEIWQNKYDVYATDKEGFTGNPAKKFMRHDLTNKSYNRLLKWSVPDVIVHCAAITNVDYCEDHPDETMTVNSESVKKLLQSQARLIFISSDAVFPDGMHMAKEVNETNAGNVYGRSKVLGEEYIQNAGENHCAVRTTIVGKNINSINQGFIEWIVHSVKTEKKITLFDDVLFTPITIWHLAEELEWVIENDISGVIHIAGKEPVSKYDFGFKICKKLGLDVSLLRKDSINNFRFLAKRSKDQTMDCTYYESISHRNLPAIMDSVNLIAKHYEEVIHG